MHQESIVYPLFTLAALTGIILTLLLYFRLKAVLEGKIEPNYLEKHGSESAPPVVVKLTHNLSNLFEYPMLFLVTGVLLIVLERVDSLYIYLAWSYVVLRYIHSVIHVTYNKVTHRSGVHFVSDMVLVVMWFRLVFQVTEAI